MNLEFLTTAIKDYLVSLGLPSGAALHYAIKGAEHFKSSICNSRDPFKEACDYAGGLAQSGVVSFKYKSPKSQPVRRKKKPQEAFNFGD